VRAPCDGAILAVSNDGFPLRSTTPNVLSNTLSQGVTDIATSQSQAIDLEQLVRVAGDAIIAANADGEIILWNPAAERMFGYTEKEALGQSLDLIIPERLRERHWTGYRQVMQTGETRYGTELLRVPAAHKDGRTLSIAFTVALLAQGDRRQIQAIVAIIRDETERWNEERALRRRIAELEAKQS
jgi:PAS domain S-box-containing protein